MLNMNGWEEGEIPVTKEEAGQRLDRYLAQHFPEQSRSYLQKLIQSNQITVNGKPEKAGYRIREQDMISVSLPEPEELSVEPEDIPLDILYEDTDIIVINKPKGMVVHPAPGHYTGTVVNALLYHCKNSLSGINGVLRPGIVHRIDRDTTGVIVACKNDFAHQSIAAQLKEHSITRTYHAIVYGHIRETDGTVNKTIGRHPVERKKMAVNVRNGKEAVTHFHVLDALDHRFTYIACNLETGRTHQIRVHMASIGHPILGDNVYGPAKCPFSLQGQTLHAKTLGFIHPTKKEYMEFDAPLPDYFEKLLTHLRNRK